MPRKYKCRRPPPRAACVVVDAVDVRLALLAARRQMRRRLDCSITAAQSVASTFSATPRAGCTNTVSTTNFAAQPVPNSIPQLLVRPCSHKWPRFCPTFPVASHRWSPSSQWQRHLARRREIWARSDAQWSFFLVAHCRGAFPNRSYDRGGPFVNDQPLGSFPIRDS